MLPSSSSSRRGAPRGKRGSPLVSSSASNSRGKGKQKEKGDRDRGDRGRSGLDPPIHDKAYIRKTHRGSNPLKAQHEDTPKSSIGNFCTIAFSKLPDYKCTQGTVVESSGKRTPMWRTTVVINVEPPIEGVGDSADKKESEKLAALSAVYQLDKLGLECSWKIRGLSTHRPLSHRLSPFLTALVLHTNKPAASWITTAGDFVSGNQISPTRRSLDRHGNSHDCRRAVHRTGKGPKQEGLPDRLLPRRHAVSGEVRPGSVEGLRRSRQDGRRPGFGSKSFFQVSGNVADRIQALCADIKKSELYKNRPAPGPTETFAAMGNAPRRRRIVGPEVLAQKSQKLLQRHEAYLVDPRMERMRTTRASLPVYTRAQNILAHVAANDTIISRKATDPPAISSALSRGAWPPSVSQTVFRRSAGNLRHSVGYHVRFENKLPEDNGSITFCTTGIFLKRMHSALSGIGDEMSTSDLDSVTHIIVDEVHERDLDTDLTLVVLKRFLSDRKARNKPLKVILMSATINPTLFQNYFPDTQGMPAKVIEVPGRSFPVVKHFLDDFVPQLVSEQPNRWVFSQEPTIKYLVKELGVQPAAQLGIRLQPGAIMNDNELELPFAFIALTISHVLQRTDSGHVLVFLPGWEEIQSVQKALLSPQGPTRLNFNDRSKATGCLRASPDGVRRIILATNIAETSVTIPDVVYVVDTAKVKEQRYDPDRHMSSLVSAWVGSSNLNQRAGRAGRHRPGEYFGILGQKHAEELHPHQTVEMKRVDLSNVVMHVKALDFPGMAVEDVLAACIEPPSPERVVAAMKDLFMVGALDEDQNLTSLGRLLLQLPVEVQMGRLVLYGSFFRCLDDALTLAAIMTNRDPFVSPLHRRKEAQERKSSWCPPECRSDVLTTLRAYNAWWAMQSRGEYVSANRFCLDNFLAKPTLLLIQKIKTHLLQSLNQAGVLDISGGGTFDASTSRMLSVPLSSIRTGIQFPFCKH
ncbi:ATP-dependent RNA helicase [Salix suchowensis]|nr:ATP-dependent RNA helicase [Salix suchowensis]